MSDNKEIQKAHRAFIVDDDKDTLAIMTHQFKSLKVDVTAVTESTTAVKEFLKATMRDGNFDLVALDIRMPNINGNEIAKQMRDTGYTGLMIALTASTTGMGRKVSKESGFDYYFSKTSINKELISALLHQPKTVAGEVGQSPVDIDDE